jgi:hypothetical protein
VVLATPSRVASYTVPLPRSPVSEPVAWYANRVRRTLDRGSGPEQVLFERDLSGRWHEVRSDGNVPVPGARDCTIEEFIGNNVKVVDRYGKRFVVSPRRTETDQALRTWCARNGDSLPDGFSIPAGTWQRAARETIARPFIPEFDHPDAAVRKAAGCERTRRAAAAALEAATRERDAAVRAVSRLSRRKLAAALGLSFARIQQIHHRDPR